MIERSLHIEAIMKRLASFEVVVILGPRQIGKTTLAKQVGKHYRGSVHQGLNLDELIVVHAGDQSYPLTKSIRAVSATRLSQDF
jgi:ABC-type phosphate/phosphonate transport system ATPase subunit